MDTNYACTVLRMRPFSPETETMRITGSSHGRSVTPVKFLGREPVQEQLKTCLVPVSGPARSRVAGPAHYCTLMLAGILLAALPVHGGVSLTSLVSFNGTNGAYPMGRLVQTADGAFYGVTQDGGAYSAGTVFKMASDGTLTTLVSFAQTNGQSPHAAVIRGLDGNFYGTTGFGGSYGNGTVYKMTPEGSLTTLFSFNGANGSRPSAELTEGSDGNFYGSTTEGGAWSNYFGFGYGTIFQITPAGALTTLVNFDGTNGGSCWGSLTRMPDGNFYGTCRLGGSYTNTFLGVGYGTFFKMTSAGTLTTLISFDGTNYGGSFYRLVPTGDGSFFETCYDVGTNLDSIGNVIGSIIRLTPGDSATTMFAFNGTNGAYPRELMQAGDGNLYGTTGIGGVGYTGIISQGPGQGTVFKMTPAGALTVLFEFTNNEVPFGGLIQASDGDLYGTTSGGGAYGAGTVFRLSVPMPAVLRSVTQKDGILTSTWSVAAGQGYQPQFCTDLSRTNWANLGPSITATNGTMNISDPIGPNPQRFYRLALLP